MSRALQSAQELSKDRTEKDLQRAAQIQMIVNALSLGKNIKEACARVGISEETWRLWRRDGHVQEVINVKFADVTSGVRDLIADSLVESTKVLCDLSRGVLPKDTDIDGTLAPRDVVQASRELRELWKELGGDVEGNRRDQERVLEQLKKSQIGIATFFVKTMNVGTEAQPVPLPVMPDAVIDGEYEEKDDE